ncbi:MAG: DUF3515 domain-containing protein [Actinomycetota bacterium]|nr:DUF3515 domain-containing protein [Actinomycetota bacterium]
MTVPLVVIVGLFLGHAQQKKATQPLISGGALALSPITVAAPPPNAAADQPCTTVLGALPITLSGLSGRPARSTWTYVAAWGDPAVVLRCGIPRPSALTPGSSAQTVGIDGVYWLPAALKNVTVWTAVDRAVYIEVSVPKSYAQPPLAPVSDAIARALPAVCVVDPNEADVSKLCTHRP